MLDEFSLILNVFSYRAPYKLNAKSVMASSTITVKQINEPSLRRHPLKLDSCVKIEFFFVLGMGGEKI